MQFAEKETWPQKSFALSDYLCFLQTAINEHKSVCYRDETYNAQGYIAGYEDGKYRLYEFSTIGELNILEVSLDNGFRVHTKRPPGMRRDEFDAVFRQHLRRKGLEAGIASPQQLFDICSPVLDELSSQNQYINNILQGQVLYNRMSGINKY